MNNPDRHGSRSENQKFNFVWLTFKAAFPLQHHLLAVDTKMISW